MRRRYRLADKVRFRQVQQEGASFANSLIVLCLLPNGESVSRCGITVSRRIGNAVMRNRTRRRMREAIRLIWDLVKPGWDTVWIARPGVVEAEFAELQNACARLLRRAHVLRAPSAPAEQTDPSG